MELKYKYPYNIEQIFFILFFSIIFLPKIDIIPVPGYWQGIRLEDFALLFYGLIVCFNYDEKIINNQILKKFLPIVVYFVIIFFSACVGKMSNLPVQYFSLLRIIEYFIIIVLICNINIDKNTIIKFLKIYLFLNIFISILQQLDLVGSFTSLGYLDPTHPLNQRSMGLTGGSWELGVIATLSYFIIMKFDKPKYINALFYFSIVLVLNLIAESRINFIAFFVANIFLLKNYFDFKKYLILIFVIILIGFFSFYNLENIKITSLNRLVQTDYMKSLEMLKNFFFYLDLPKFEEIGTTEYSLLHRFNHWNKLIVPYLDNFYTIIFGSGPYALYYESSILRIILTTGLIGLTFCIYSIRKIELYILVYFILSGLTLDLFVSFKIYSFTILYYKLLYENYSYRRN